MRFLRGNIIGLLALFVALSGSAYAAYKVGPRDIRPNSIRTWHIKRNQIRWSDLNVGIRRRLVRPGAPGPSGPEGPEGPKGPRGQSGSDATEELRIKKVEGDPLVLGPEEFGGAPVAQCPDGYVVVGTAFDAGLTFPGFVLSFGTFVGGFFDNESSLETEASVEALCAKNSGGGASFSSARGWRQFQRELRRARRAHGF